MCWNRIVGFWDVKGMVVAWKMFMAGLVEVYTRLLPINKSDLNRWEFMDAVQMYPA